MPRDARDFGDASVGIPCRRAVALFASKDTELWKSDLDVQKKTIPQDGVMSRRD